MNLRSIDLNLIPVFDAIFTEGKLTRAAERLAMSQPAMSNALARLRATVDDPLFIRTARGMVPTPRARQMAGQIRQALNLIHNSLQQNTEFDFSASTRTFSIAVEDYGEAVIIPPLMDWLTRAAPGIQTRIWPGRSRAVREELRNGMVDFAVDYFRLEGQGFRSTHLMTDELVSMVRKDHPVIGETLSLDQYVTLPHVVLAQNAPMVDRELTRRGLTRNRALHVPHFISMPLIVKSTDFICTLPRRMASVYMEHFPVKILTSPIDFPKIPIYLVWSDVIGTDPGHQWLRDSLYSLCQRL
jgi:DNA-binding transcriptional LysR family regulator